MGRTTRNINNYGDVNKTAIIEARVDIRTVALCLKFYRDSNVHIFTKSDLIRAMTESFAQILIDNKLAERIEDFQEAQDIMNTLPRTSRDRRADLHVSAIVNKKDFEKSIERYDVHMYVQPDTNRHEPTEEEVELLSRMITGVPEPVLCTQREQREQREHACSRLFFNSGHKNDVFI